MVKTKSGVKPRKGVKLRPFSNNDRPPTPIWRIAKAKKLDK